ncbi:hypothetical protein GIX45_17860 [Erwinia sp. CPCC 100877]|nr:hypothetical protein [Erwinia sp. CPCC 100877]
MTTKVKWLLLFFIDNLLFLVALATNSILVYVLVIALSFYVYKNGSSVLLKEYNERKKRRQAEYRLVQEAAKKTIRTGRLLKSRRSCK